MPHLLRHVYNGHLRGPVPLTPVAERLAVELSLPGLSRPGLEPRSPAHGENGIPTVIAGRNVVIQNDIV